MIPEWATLATAFAGQAEFCNGYSSLYEAIYTHAAVICNLQAKGEPLQFDEQALVDLLATESESRSFMDVNALELSLLFPGAIHASVLNEDPEATAISRFFPTVGGSYEPEWDRDVLLQMLGGLYMKPGPTLRAFLRNGRVQTNEVSRGAGWLLPASVLTAWAGGDLPITLVDLGCSAGLNLVADRQTWAWNASDGDRTLGSGDPLIQQRLDFGKAEPEVREALPVGPIARPHIVARHGFDTHPLDPTDPAMLLNLRAVIWGDQVARLERFDRAIAAYQSAQPPPQLHQGNIIADARRLPDYVAPGTRLLLVFNSAVTIYFADAEYTALHESVRDAFRALPAGVTGLWLELEVAREREPSTLPKLSALKAHILIDGELMMRYLAYAEPHPQTWMLLEGWSELRSLLK